MNKQVITWAVVAFMYVVGVRSANSEDHVKSLNFLSKSFTIDRQYPSMMGPSDGQKFVLDKKSLEITKIEKCPPPYF